MIVYNPLAAASDPQAPRAMPLPRRTPSRLAPRESCYRERYWQAAQFHAVAELRDSAPERALNLATASIAWVLNQPGITAAIVGASRPEQLEATLAAADMTLDDETLGRLQRRLVVAPSPAAVVRSGDRDLTRSVRSARPWLGQYASALMTSPAQIEFSPSQVT